MKPRERTHWTDCWRDHHECAVAEVERLRADLAAARALLREAVARLAGDRSRPARLRALRALLRSAIE